jgi:hypothetical protein
VETQKRFKIERDYDGYGVSYLVVDTSNKTVLTFCSSEHEAIRICDFQNKKLELTHEDE